MFRTALPSAHSVQPKTPLHRNHCGGMNHVNATVGPVYNLMYPNMQPCSGKPCGMAPRSDDAQTLVPPAVAALYALRSANEKWLERESQKARCHLTARDVIVRSQQHNSYGCSVDGCTQSRHSTTSQNQSSCGTEESSPIWRDGDDNDGSVRSRHSTVNARPRNDIIQDLQRLVKKERRQSRSQVSQGQDCHADDAVSESGVFTLEDYSDVGENGESELEEPEFKLYPDHRDHAALVEHLFRQEDEEAVIERVFCAGRRTTAPRCEARSDGG